MRSLGFNASRTALMTNAITLAQVIGSLLAANVLLRMGPRHAFTLASGLIVLGGLVSLTDAFPLIFFIRFVLVLGLSGALMVVLLSGIVARLLTGGALQVANGLNSVAFNAGLAVALTFGSQMAGNPAFAAVLAASLSLVLLLLWLIVARRGLKGPVSQGVAVDSSFTMRDGFRQWFNWVFALSSTGFLSYYIVAFTFMDPETIRWVVSAGVVGALSATLVSTRVPDVHKPTVVVVCGAA
ncbi:MFS transporter [Paeniglutamicibacter cryotolerans]|uniref:MFS family permease n=1 Tax=Paeniglutamicibacter cryotolerans TaxID=670079 RepID=A0A839QGD1_9MICC|nr:MFS transporter [Paeniglutamicibacter cryotolerans]MBB2994673.1 MFS family permease [Paeniglutamicibacter cryotolerans]